jgi:hypothetical protein
VPSKTVREPPRFGRVLVGLAKKSSHGLLLSGTNREPRIFPPPAPFPPVYAPKETTTAQGVDDVFGDSHDIKLPAPWVRAI